MTRNENIVFYATAKRASAGEIHQIVDGCFKRFWIGRLRGMFVGPTGGKWKFDTREEAVDCARRFRQGCIDEAIELGLDI